MKSVLLGLGIAAALFAAAAPPNEYPFIDGISRTNPLTVPVNTLQSNGCPVFQFSLPATIKPIETDGDSPSLVLKLGYILPMEPQICNSIVWTEFPDGSKAARVEFMSENATGLRFRFKDVPKNGVEIRMYDPKTGEVFAPNQGLHPNDDGWWGPTVYGNTAGIEFYVPPGFIGTERTPEISAIEYRYNDEGPLFADCLVDVQCYSATWANERDAVGNMSFNDGTYSYGCTGALLNRTGTDLAPIFMTAHHCISTQYMANTLEVVWFWQTASCNGTVPSYNSLPRNNGSLLLKKEAASEWTLLGLYNPASGGYWCGWDSNYFANGSSMVGIHHPGGQYKRITFGTKVGDASCLGATDELDIDTISGGVRPGSSGSPAFDLSKRVRGTASCAGPDKNTSCPPDEWITYGSMYAFFNVGRYYIYNMASPVYVSKYVAGDTGNDGTSEQGTSTNPFNTAYEGIHCAATGDTVYIRFGNYNEKFTAWRGMTLRAWGGEVTIGRP